MTTAYCFPSCAKITALVLLLPWFAGLGEGHAQLAVRNCRVG